MRQSIFRFGRILPILPCLLALGGCAGSAGLFLPVNQHPELMSEARQAVVQDNPRRLGASLENLEKRVGANSRMLYLLEAARLESLAGQTENSVELYAEADQRFDDDLIRASLSVSETLQGAVSVMTNDRALAYNGQLYERLMLHTFQALNFLKLGQPDQARIQLNKALRDMRWGKDNLPELRRKADQRLAEANLRTGGFSGRFADAPDGLVQEDSSDNALVYYLSGLLFQAGGDAGRAEIDYRNALAYAPDSKPILAALDSLKAESAGTGRLVILHESDWVSAKIPFSLPVFIKNRSYTLSFPYYSDHYGSAQMPEAFLHVGDRKPLLYPVLNLDAVVRRALEEQLPAILLRQALRMVAKEQIQSEAAEQDQWLGLAVSIFSILSDSPDLRSWLSLPAAVYLADIQLPAGDYDVFTDLEPGPPALVRLKEGEIRILRVITAGERVIVVDSFSVSP